MSSEIVIRETFIYTLQFKGSARTGKITQGSSAAKSRPGQLHLHLRWGFFCQARLLVTLWTMACQALLSFTISRSLLRFTSIELMMPSSPSHPVCRSPGSFVHGILQARILEWVAISLFRGSSRLRD